jgi:hypothetical protein
MKTDKELALVLVDRVEEYYRRTTLMELILDTSKVPGWRQRFAEVFPDPQIRERVHKLFQPVRARILDAPDLTSAVHEMLKDIPESPP